MAYSTQTDLEAIAGTSNVAVWSNLESDSTTANTTRITAAIAWADALLNSKLRKQYAIPLTNIDGGDLPDDVVRVSALLALAWLVTPREANTDDDRAGTFRAEANAAITAWLGGSIDPGLTRRATVEPRAPFGARG